METAYAVLDQFGETKKLIEFKICYPNENEHNANTSLQWFNTRELKAFNKVYEKAQKDPSKAFLILNSLPNKTTIFYNHYYFNNYLQAYTDLKVTTVNSVWEMYQEIGYDYKTKKYIERN